MARGKRLQQVEIMDAKLRRHKLVQQRAEQGGERGVLAVVEFLLLFDAIQD